MENSSLKFFTGQISSDRSYLFTQSNGHRLGAIYQLFRCSSGTRVVTLSHIWLGVKIRFLTKVWPWFLTTYQPAWWLFWVRTMVHPLWESCCSYLQGIDHLGLEEIGLLALQWFLGILIEKSHPPPPKKYPPETMVDEGDLHIFHCLDVPQ